MSELRAHDRIRHHARRRPQKIAIVDYETGSKLTYGAMDKQGDNCVAFLHRGRHSKYVKIQWFHISPALVSHSVHICLQAAIQGTIHHWYF